MHPLVLSDVLMKIIIKPLKGKKKFKAFCKRFLFKDFNFSKEDKLSNLRLLLRKAQASK